MLWGHVTICAIGRRRTWQHARLLTMFLCISLRSITLILQPAALPANHRGLVLTVLCRADDRCLWRHLRYESGSAFVNAHFRTRFWKREREERYQVSLPCLRILGRADPTRKRIPGVRM